MSRQERKRRRKRSRVPAILITLGLLAASAYFIWNITSQVSVTYTLLVDRREARQELNELQQESEELQEMLTKLQDKNYIENYARGEYLITKDGEEIYRLPSSSSDSEN